MNPDLQIPKVLITSPPLTSDCQQNKLIPYVLPQTKVIRKKCHLFLPVNFQAAPCTHLATAREKMEDIMVVLLLANIHPSTRALLPLPLAFLAELTLSLLILAIPNSHQVLFISIKVCSSLSQFGKNKQTNKQNSTKTKTAKQLLLSHILLSYISLELLNSFSYSFTSNNLPHCIKINLF